MTWHIPQAGVLGRPSFLFICFSFLLIFIYFLKTLFFKIFLNYYSLRSRKMSGEPFYKKNLAFIFLLNPHSTFQPGWITITAPQPNPSERHAVPQRNPTYLLRENWRRASPCCRSTLSCGRSAIASPILASLVHIRK
jgi:hypothetical protein